MMPHVASASGWLRDTTISPRPCLVEGVMLTICSYGTLIVVGRIAGLASRRHASGRGRGLRAGRVVIDRRASDRRRRTVTAARPPATDSAGNFAVTVGLGTVGAAVGSASDDPAACLGAWLRQVMAALAPLLPHRRSIAWRGRGAGTCGGLTRLQAIARFIFRLATAVALVAAAAVDAAFAGTQGAATALAGAMTLSCLSGPRCSQDMDPRRLAGHSAGDTGRPCPPNNSAQSTIRELTGVVHRRIARQTLKISRKLFRRTRVQDLNVY